MRVSQRLVCLATFVVAASVCLVTSVASSNTFHASLSGSNTPPYDTYAKAAHRVADAVLAATGPGDTVLVHTGTYNFDTTIMIPAGLTFAGTGCDSVVLNWAVTEFRPGTLAELKGDNEVYGLEFDYPMGSSFNDAIQGVYSYNTSAITIHGCRFRELSVVTGNSGSLEADSNEFLFGQTYGLNLANGHSSVHHNSFWGSSGGSGVMCFYAGAVLIENNVFHNAPRGRPTGVDIWHASWIVVRNNLFLNASEPVSWFYASGIVENNTMIGSTGHPTGEPVHNTIGGALRYYETLTMRNNIMVDFHALYEFSTEYDACCDTTGLITFVHNAFWPPVDSFYTISPSNQPWRVKIRDSANFIAYPMFVSDSTYRLQRGSPLIDAGDPAVKDADSSRSDIGRWGGPQGSTYAYPELPPFPPDSVWDSTSGRVATLYWSPRSEADLAGYRLYRGDYPGFWSPGIVPLREFGPGITRAVDTIPSTKAGVGYVVTSFDTTGLESAPSLEVVVTPTDTGGQDTTGSVVPRTPGIIRAYPNPFNAETVIEVYIPAIGAFPAPAEIEVFDASGRRAATAFEGQLNSGRQSISWDASQKGVALASGVYFVRLKVRSQFFGTPFKLVLIK